MDIQNNKLRKLSPKDPTLLPCVQTPSQMTVFKRLQKNLVSGNKDIT